MGELNDALLDQLVAISAEVLLPIMANDTKVKYQTPEARTTFFAGAQRFIANGA
jgi:hypothetical protein